MKLVDDVVAGYERTVAFARRSRAFDHLWRARERYNAVMGGRLAAAIAYYGFFAAFALALLAYSILGFAVTARTDLRVTVSEFLQNNLPWLDVEQVQQARGTIALVGAIGLVLTGVGWVEGMRSSQRLVWDLDEQPGNVIIRRLVDLGMLVGLGLLLGASLWVSSGIERFLFYLSPQSLTPAMQDAFGWIGLGLGWLVNLLLAAALLAAVPRLRMPVRRLLPSTLLVGLGVTLLTTIGQLLIERTKQNPVGQVAGGVVGLLTFLYLFSQLLLFGAALAATSEHGKVMDLAAGPAAPPVDPPPIDPPPDGSAPGGASSGGGAAGT